VFLIVLSTALSIIALSIGAGLFFVQGSTEQSIEKDMAAIADISNELISTTISLLEADAASVASEVAKATPEELQATLQQELALYPDFIALTLFDRTGVVASYGVAPTPESFLHEECIETAFNGKPFISTSMQDPTGELVFHVVVPAGKDAVLSATIPGLYFSDELASFTIWETGHIFIVDADGYILANIRENWVLERYNFPEMRKTDSQYERIGGVIAAAIQGEPGSGRFEVGGEERICVYAPITGSSTGWVLGVIAPISESPLGSIQTSLQTVGIVCLLLSIIAALIASFVLGKPYREINELVVSLENKSEDLVRARERAEANAEAKSDFLANMSHEMRTPLNAIIGLSELALGEEDLDKNVEHKLEQVYNSGITLLHLINDILDISKISSGKFDLIEAEYDTAGFINDTAALNAIRIGAKPLTFKLVVNENLPSALIGDELRIKQIFNNLLSNAFKYTDKGCVTWTIASEQDGGDLWLVSSVQDTGFGIRQEDLGKLFGEYNQIDAKSNRKIEGTGLGLPIAKNLVELMEGSIAVSSEYGEGSTFSVRIKQTKACDGNIGAEVAEKLAGLNYSERKRDRSEKLVRAHLPNARVLVVDDVATNLEVARGMMLPYNMRIDCVLSGQQAIDLVRTEKVTYDAIFMDHMMPGMDGVEATRIIREEIGTEYAQTIPIIALTANAVVGTEEMFLSNGFQAFLSKPIDIARMDYIINHWIRDKAAEKSDPN
jgi:signal transduction histidine kinase/CheY-like chemotaxis protein